MDRCAVCRSQLKGADTCRRCGADWSRARGAAEAADTHYRAARSALAGGDPQTMLIHARLAHSKRRIPETGRLLACAEMLCGNHARALAAWREACTLAGQRR